MALVSGPGRGGGGSGKSLPSESSLAINKHVKYVQSLDTRKNELEYWLTEHLRMNGIYWGLTAIHLLGQPDALPREKTIEFVRSCQNADGGFGAAPGHDSHMLYTVSAIQILATIESLSELDQSGGPERVGKYIANLQNRDSGTFAGDEWGECDTRFLYGALNALSILNLMSLVDVEKAVAHVESCANFDGGYGTVPGAESHAGQIFTCVAALAIARRLDTVDIDRLGAWLSERQLPNGGLNGRPEKLEDVCYSWWVLSSLAIIGKLHWINAEKLTTFILRCQDQEHGGISDRPGDMVDVYHTVFGIAGLSLLGYPELVEVDPVYLDYVMDLDLLNCSICPKQPSFSDISHLLTHVNSKGHLSHLHKLQIRAYQEIAAGIQLSTYNDWYQQHGLGQMLSDRMVQKEAKKPKRKPLTQPKRQSVDSKVESVNEDLAVKLSPLYSPQVDFPHRRVHKPYKKTRIAHKPPQIDFLDGDISSPLKRSRRLRQPSYSATPLREQPRVARTNDSDDEYPAEIDPLFLVTPNHKKLKGIIWPGMGIFDAASLEEQRLRNQKKDGSIVKRMERLSRLVLPAETVYSPGGTMRKQRHLDDLEDGSSLIDGESPIVKKNPRAKTRSFGKRSTNKPRLVKRRPNVKRPKKEKRSINSTGIRYVDSLTSSPTWLPIQQQPRYTPTADENLEFKLTVGNMLKRKKIGHFTIFDDSTKVPGTAMVANPLKCASPPNQPYTPPAQRRLSFVTAPWLQPQNQNPLHRDNQFMDYRHLYSVHANLHHDVDDKENLLPVLGDSPSYEDPITNPLAWRETTPVRSVLRPGDEVTSGMLPVDFTNTANLSDPFGFTRNPLYDTAACSLSSEFNLPFRDPGQEVTANVKASTPLVAIISDA